MTPGIQVLNQSGLVQIDENYKNLLKVAEGTHTGGADLVTVNFSPQYECAPMIFVRTYSDNTYVSLGYVSQSSAVIITNGPIDWVVYGLNDVVQISATTHGIQVFNSSGSTVYDSRFEAARIQTVAAVDMPYPDHASEAWKGGGPHSGVHPSYPYSVSFQGWGARPWIGINDLVGTQDGFEAFICVASVGDNTIVVNCAGDLRSDGWVMGTNDGSNGYLTASIAGGKLRLPLLRKT